MAQSVQGKTAIVTGAGSGKETPLRRYIKTSLIIPTGINLAFARLLLCKGCNVVFGDLGLRPDAKELVDSNSTRSEQGAGQAIFQKTDVTDWTQLAKMFDVAQNHFGGVDVICPGAGVYEPVRCKFPSSPASSLFVQAPQD